MNPKKFADTAVITTGDGSHSLYNEELDETYHSRHGAIAESRYVFINQGVKYLKNLLGAGSINLLEIGMGTGLNVLLTYMYWQEQEESLPLQYYTLEPYPLKQKIIDELNYLEKLQRTDLNSIFNGIHQSPWNREVQLSSKFKLIKLAVTLDDFEPGHSYNLVYFDAFAPNKQEELWTVQSLKKLYDCMAKPSVLVTYAAQGNFKRNLKQAGFEVETLEGPPGKAEMVRAQKV